MEFDATAGFVVAVLFAAALARSTLGFGDALVAMPFLALAVDIRLAAPLVALVSVTIAVAITARDWRNVSLGDARPLVAASLVGIPLGIWFLTLGAAAHVKLVLAIVVLAFSAYNLLRPGWHLGTNRTAWLFGFVAGILGGAYNTQGPPLVIYGTLRRWSSETFRATLQAYFLTSICIVAGHYLVGLWSSRMWFLFAVSLPAVAAAIPLGRAINRRVPAARFVRVVYVALLVSGVSLLREALTAMD